MPSATVCPRLVDATFSLPFAGGKHPFRNHKSVCLEASSLLCAVRSPTIRLSVPGKVMRLFQTMWHRRFLTRISNGYARHHTTEEIAEHGRLSLSLNATKEATTATRMYMAEWPGTGQHRL